ncbi:hypothetical protein HS088_TW12G00887 [Tripterygium wilfordii]|uniref:C2H2-type domain-containing protein n=1 Tax=Tripterygium wilfordii TaxID=458696 RepID=A0A7J7D067_TRIWF|nr:uncharacterized protein LOC120010321 [Tripterygium wilfordii]KAF5739678.1 hypothetical protein HS088_TW12G00887 [Tripterygium wilfordii]
MARPRNPKNPMKEIQQDQNKKVQKLEITGSWKAMRGFFTSKYLQPQQQQKQEKQKPEKQNKEQKQHRQEQGTEEGNKKCKKMKCSGSLCSNTKVMHRPESSPEVQRKRASSMGSNNESSSRSMKTPLHELNGVVSSTNSSLSVSSNSSIGGSFRGMPFRRFSGCYECRMVVDPVLGFTRDPSLRTTICSCPDCGEIFMKPENLELHQTVRHGVSELGPEDTSRNIVEIIFQSSWLKKQIPVCKIDRILKVQNTQRTISRFEEYRDSIKAKANKHSKKHPRCIADGNELLRFHCTTFTCSLGLNGSSNLCNSIPNCNVCSIIKNGFKIPEGSTGEGANVNGILTTATSGKADDKAEAEDGNDKRAMLVCRVIAGRVKKGMEGSMDEYDSLAGAEGLYSNLDELYVFNPKAILPCFVVVY